jgi:hypothetical protein
MLLYGFVNAFTPTDTCTPCLTLPGTMLIYSQSRKQLGKAMGKKIRVSCVGVQSTEGAYDIFKKVNKLHLAQREVRYLKPRGI